MDSRGQLHSVNSLLLYNLNLILEWIFFCPLALGERGLGDLSLAVSAVPAFASMLLPDALHIPASDHSD